MIGKKILHYKIIEKLGEGGMFQKNCLNRHAELDSASILFIRSRNKSRRKTDQSTDWFGMTSGGVEV